MLPQRRGRSFYLTTIYLKVRDAMQRLQVTEETELRGLRAGTLPGVWIGGANTGWRIPAAVIERWLADVGPVCQPVQAVVWPDSPTAILHRSSCTIRLHRRSWLLIS